MATLYIAEYADYQKGNALAMEPAAAEQTVSIGGTSTQSSTVNPVTELIRIHTDAICSIAIGTNPTATTSKKRLAANQTEYFKIPVNKSYKIAVITNT